MSADDWRARQPSINAASAAMTPRQQRIKAIDPLSSGYDSTYRRTTRDEQLRALRKTIRSHKAEIKRYTAELADLSDELAELLATDDGN